MAISRFISCFNVTILKETEISQVSGKWKNQKLLPYCILNTWQIRKIIKKKRFEKDQKHLEKYETQNK